MTFTPKQLRYIAKGLKGLRQVGRGARKVAMHPNTVGTSIATGLGLDYVHQRKTTVRRSRREVHDS